MRWAAQPCWTPTPTLTGVFHCWRGQGYLPRSPRSTLTLGILSPHSLVPSQFCSGGQGPWMMGRPQAFPLIPEEMVVRVAPSDNDSLQSCMTTMPHEPIVQKGLCEQELN